MDKELAACRRCRDEDRARYERESQNYKQKTEELILQQSELEKRIAETKAKKADVVARMTELQQRDEKNCAYYISLLARVKQRVHELEHVYGTLDALLKVFGAGEMLGDALARARACVGRQAQCNSNPVI